MIQNVQLLALCNCVVTMSFGDMRVARLVYDVFVILAVHLMLCVTNNDKTPQLETIKNLHS